MNPTVVGMVVFACTLGGALVGHWLRATLPENYLDDESKDTVKLGIGLVATMTALVLGLVTASAKNSFDAVDTAVKHTAMDVLTVDRLLARYGPETGELRGALKQAIASRIDMVWPQGSSQPAHMDPIRSGAASAAEGLADGIRSLVPRNDSQRSLQSRALDLTESMLEARWGIAVGGTSVPLPFLVVLLFWLTITFASFGLFAPRNALVFAVLFVCAMSVGSAVFLILELDGPFDGLLRVSADPMRYAYAHLNE
jgi:hypothetical protein